MAPRPLVPICKHFTGGVPFTQNGLFPAAAELDVEDYVSAVGQGAAHVADVNDQLRDAAIALRAVADELGSILDDMAWLGPLRSALERFYAPSEGDQAMGLGARDEHVGIAPTTTRRRSCSSTNGSASSTFPTRASSDSSIWHDGPNSLATGP